jgi:hypothetical protein
MIVRLFSSCSIETIRDDLGNELIPDLDDNVYFGLTILPKAFQIRVVERPNKLI